MTGKEAYKIYAPFGAKWTEWIRPVPFVAIDTYNRKPCNNLIYNKNMFLDQYQKDTAIFIDLPAKETIEMSIDLARIGFRPIPLFNGTDEQNGAQATTDTYLVEMCLINGAEKLKNIKLEDNANPAFLLDSSRTNRYRAKESIYDNSWDLYGQDIPSLDCFIKNGITKIIIVGNKIQSDLKQIFFKFQKAGIKFYLTDGYLPIKELKITKTIRERFKKEEL